MLISLFEFAINYLCTFYFLSFDKCFVSFNLLRRPNGQGRKIVYIFYFIIFRNEFFCQRGKIKPFVSVVSFIFQQCVVKIESIYKKYYFFHTMPFMVLTKKNPSAQATRGQRDSRSSKGWCKYYIYSFPICQSLILCVSAQNILFSNLIYFVFFSIRNLHCYFSFGDQLGFNQVVTCWIYNAMCGFKSRLR